MRNLGSVLALIGGVLLAVGPFLPWMTMGMLSADGLVKTSGDAQVLIVLGVLGTVFPLMSFARPDAAHGLLAVMAGLVAAKLMHKYTIRLIEQCDSMPPGLRPELGAGVYLCWAGIGLLIVGGMMSGLRGLVRKSN